jgi:hypothetical protein
MNLSLGLIYHSKALPQPPSRETIPLRYMIMHGTSTGTCNMRSCTFFSLKVLSYMSCLTLPEYLFVYFIGYRSLLCWLTDCINIYKTQNKQHILVMVSKFFLCLRLRHYLQPKLNLKERNLNRLSTRQI